MRQISVTTLRGNTRGEIFDAVIAMAAVTARPVLMNFRGIINFISENICPPNESRHWLFSAGECYFPKSVNRNSAGDLAGRKYFSARGTIARIKIDELYEEHDPLLHYYAPRNAVCNENALCADP